MKIVHAIAGLLLFLSAPAEAQWTEEPGAGWMQLTGVHQDTRSRFDQARDKVPIFGEGGRSITTSLVLTGALGLLRGFDVWLSVPVHRLSFNDVAADRQSTGLGDVRIYARIGSRLVTTQPVPVVLAIRAGLKLSVSEFPVDAEIVPLTEGQRDWELMIEGGRALPRRSYAAGWIGYRWRETNTRINRKPGNEWFAFFYAGGDIRRVVWKLSVDVLRGQTPRILGLPIGSATRESIQLWPQIGHRVGPGAVELGLRIPVQGRNLPAGTAVTLGYFFRFRG